MKNSYLNSNKTFRKYNKFVGSTRPDLEGGYPVVIDRGNGAFVYDIDGNRYIDFTCATGASILGYANERVIVAVQKSVERGNLFITPFSETMGELAEELINTFKNSEKAIFFKTGSEATTAAIRIARVYTKKEIVLTSGYHGWHDWQLTIFPKFRQPLTNTFDFFYNINRLEYLLDKYKNKVACIIITPEPAFFESDYFYKINSIAKKYNVLLIFDEVMSGFRYSLGGFQNTLKIKPDITVIGKGLANEFPISAVLGKQEIIDARDNTHLAGTYNHELSSIVAAKQTIKIVSENEVIKYNNQVGGYFLKELKQLFTKFGVKVLLTENAPAIFHMIFENEDFAQEFYSRCLNNGIFLNRFDQQMVSFSHNYSIIDEAIQKIELSLKSLTNKFPNEFNQENCSISSKALNYRTLHEFGGLVDYNIPHKQVPLKWEQDDR